MNKKLNPSKFLRWLGVFVFVVCTSFGVHKFYMGIYQVEYVPAKKRLQI
jgi:TM2 domain-containing membrane protein YozV